MKVFLLVVAGALLLPRWAPAQRLAATQPPVACHVGLTKTPLYRSAADTSGRPSRYLFSQEETSVVGRFSPRWVVVKHDGFLYLTPAARLSDYDPADATPPPLDPQTQLITYQGVVLVPGATQAELFARAQAWVARAYPLHNAEIERQDPAAGQLALRGTRLVALRTSYDHVARPSCAGVVTHQLTIYVKDGRYKFILTNLRHDARGTPNLRSGGPLEPDKANLSGYAGLGSGKPWADLKQAATRDIRGLLASLQAALTLGQAPPAADPSKF